MIIQARANLDEVLTQIGLDEQPKMLGMHLSEIEEESDHILDLLTVVRVNARTGDAEAGQETLAELTVALGHLLHHVREATPLLQKQLDLEELALTEEA
ncbi:MAG: hypothetical protein U0350_23820 [Caldilineaceae bacterium]